MFCFVPAAQISLCLVRPSQKTQGELQCLLACLSRSNISIWNVFCKFWSLESLESLELTLCDYMVAGWRLLFSVWPLQNRGCKTRCSAALFLQLWYLDLEDTFNHLQVQKPRTNQRMFFRSAVSKLQVKLNMFCLLLLLCCLKMSRWRGHILPGFGTWRSKTHVYEQCLSSVFYSIKELKVESRWCMFCFYPALSKYIFLFCNLKAF
jgi:hypothetical protein